MASPEKAVDSPKTIKITEFNDCDCTTLGEIEIVVFIRSINENKNRTIPTGNKSVPNLKTSDRGYKLCLFLKACFL